MVLNRDSRAGSGCRPSAQEDTISIELLAVSLAALAAALPFVLERYVQRLPEAPACPCCRTPTHQATSAFITALERIPSLAVTYVGECARCGWRGRLRWRWATRSVRDGR